MKLIGYVVYILYMACTLWLLATALIQLHLYWLAKKIKRKKPMSGVEDHPFVSIQVPVYNERYVIEELLETLAALDYPKNRYEIQVLDDSTDDTSAIIDKVANRLTQRKVDISVIRRTNRVGYKAGALQHGLAACKGEFIAIFDADFRPPANFFSILLPQFIHDRVGLVQARWGHQNIGQNFLTRIQSYLLDMHFKVEQEGRFNAGYFMNFCGTAGIWRKQCILDAGGWDSHVLSEDLDISYRAQLKGWSIILDNEMVVPAQLPAVIEAFKIQQFRWTKGIAQIAKKTLKSIFQLDLPLSKKLHSVFHLLSSFSFVCIFISALLALPLLVLRNTYPEFITLSNYTMIAVLNLAALTFIYYKSAHESEGKALDFIAHYPLFIVVYLAMSVQNAVAVMQGFSGLRSPFVRTPKSNDRVAAHAYVDRKINWITFLEFGMLLYFAFGIFLSFYLGDYFLLSFFLMFSWGLVILIYQTLKTYIVNTRRVFTRKLNADSWALRN